MGHLRKKCDRSTPRAIVLFVAGIQMIAQESHLGFGVYPVVNAARIVGVPPRRIKYWLDTDSGLIAWRYSPDEDTMAFFEPMVREVFSRNPHDVSVMKPGEYSGLPDPA